MHNNVIAFKFACWEHAKKTVFHKNKLFNRQNVHTQDIHRIIYILYNELMYKAIITVFHVFTNFNKFYAQTCVLIHLQMHMASALVVSEVSWEE